jgi:hypothetical protein
MMPTDFKVQTIRESRRGCHCVSELADFLDVWVPDDLFEEVKRRVLRQVLEQTSLPDLFSAAENHYSKNSSTLS